MGQGRIGVRLTSLVATLRLVMRLPIRHIQMYLQTRVLTMKIQWMTADAHIELKRLYPVMI